MNNRPVVALMLVLGVAGCDRNEQPAAAAASTVRAPQAAGGDAVAAVLQSTGTPVAKLAFALLAKPVHGVEAVLRLDVSVEGAVPALLLVAEAEGLNLDARSATATLALATPGAVASHELQFTPLQAGLAEVTVRLRSAEGEGAETVYVIPVLVEAAAAG